MLCDIILLSPENVDVNTVAEQPDTPLIHLESKTRDPVQLGSIYLKDRSAIIQIG
jgi:hypothetical protein